MVKKALGRLTVRTNNICCPHCNESLWELELPFSAHNVTIENGDIITSKGRTHLSYAMCYIMMLLLQSHPLAIGRNSLLYLYEHLDSTYTEGVDTNTLRVQLSRMRKLIKPLGITLHCIWGQGYRLELDI